MTALTLHVLFTVLFFHTIRKAQVGGRNVMLVAAVNYLVAAPVCFGISALQGNLAISGETLLWGMVHGVMFAVTYYLLCSSMSVSGLAIATALVRLSVVIPVVASIVVWREIPTWLQLAGIVACVVALPLIGLRTRASELTVTRRLVWMVGALIVGMGIANVAAKAFVEAGTGDARTTYSGVLFGTAAVICLGITAGGNWRRNLTGFKDGIQLGLVNAATLVTYMLALEQLPGVVFFPAQAAGGLLLNTLFAAWIWGERFQTRTLAGMGVAAVGLILVNAR